MIEEGTEAFRKVLEKLFNLATGVERSEFLGAEPYERTSQRRGHANGYKDKKISTRVGELRLKIPQVRGLSEIKTFRWYYDNEPVQRFKNIRVALRRWLARAHNRPP